MILFEKIILVNISNFVSPLMFHSFSWKQQKEDENYFGCHTEGDVQQSFIKSESWNKYD